MNVWRVDNYYRSVEEADVYDDTPLNIWHSALMGGGEYMYVTTEQDAKKVLVEVIECEIAELTKQLEGLQ